MEKSAEHTRRREGVGGVTLPKGGGVGGFQTAKMHFYKK